MKALRCINPLVLVVALTLVLAGCSAPDLLVLDSNGTPLSDAKIVGSSLSMNGKTTKSNSRGEARIPWSIQETKWVSVYKDGFVPVENISVDQQKPIIIKLHRESASAPEVVGSARFKEQVHRAIALLQERDLDAYEIIRNNVGRIQESERSGMRAYDTPPVYDMSDATAFYSVTWCAATIAHDSFHSKLYHGYQSAHPGPVPDSVWSGRAAEQECMKHQLDVMRRLGASDQEITYAKTQADGHYVTNAASWQEYQSRKW